MTPVSLHHVLDAVRRHLEVRLGTSLALAAGAVVALVLALAWLLAGSDGWTPGTALPLLLLLGGAAAVVGLGAWAVRTRRRWTGEGSLAGEIERVTRLPQGSVRAQAELGRSVPPGVSASLAGAGEVALLRRIPGEAATLAGAPGRAVSRALGAAGIGLGLGLTAVLALFFLSPDRARTAWAGLAHPADLLIRPALPPLELRPGDARIPRGEAPRVEVVAPGRDSVTLHWRAVGEVEESSTIAVAGSLAELTLRPLEAALTYWATSRDGARTPSAVLTPSDPSLLADLLVELTYPRHTRLPPESFRGAPEALAVPEGTILRFTGGLQGGGSAVLLRDPSGVEVLRLPIADDRFAGELSAVRSTVVEWVVEGGLEGGLLPPPLDLEVVADAAPRLTFPEPGTGGELPLSLRLPLLLDAVDDYGVSWIEIETRLRDLEGAALPGGSVDRIPTNDRPSVILHPNLDFSAWGIRPGEQIVVRARVADNAPTPHVVESATYVLRMPRESELRDIARDRLQEAAARTEELVDRARREEAELRDLERRARLGDNSPGGNDVERQTFEERQEVQQAVEQQAQIAREIQEIQERLAEAAQSLGDESPEDLALAERIEELSELLENVLGAEAREQLQELLDALEQGEPLGDDTARTAGDLAQRQQQMRERLEQMLDRLRRSVLEESMRGAEEELRSLSESQNAVVDSLRQGTGVEQQQAIERRAESLEQQLGDLGNELRAQAEPEAAAQTDQAKAEVGQAREAMQQGIQEAAQGQDQAASDRAAQAADALAGALGLVEEARNEMEEEWRSAMREGLRRGAQDALALARRQEEIGDRVQNAGPQRRAEFEGEEAAIRDGLRNLANSLAEATVQVPDVGRTLSDAVGRAIASTESALETLRGTGQAAIAQAAAAVDAAQQALNDIAMEALRGLAEAGQSGQAGATMSQIRAEMEALAAAQESVNRGSSDLGDDPGQDGATARLEQLAQAQETIAGRLGEMARRPGAGQAPGNMQALSEEAEEIAEQMRNQRLDATTLERQTRFLDLLLSAGRTLERDEPTDERESRETGFVERRSVSPIPDYYLEARSVPLPSAEALEALTPAERRLVLEYFERMNSRRARGDGAP